MKKKKTTVQISGKKYSILNMYFPHSNIYSDSVHIIDRLYIIMLLLKK